MASLENNSKWLKSQLPIFKANFDYVNKRILEVNPKYTTAVDRILTEKAELLQAKGGSGAFQWVENIFSLGGSAIREVGKIRRVAEAKSQLEIKSIEISYHNEAALRNADNYQQYLRESAFYRDIESQVEAHNRVWRLDRIEKMLEQKPENAPLLSEKQKLLQEQKEYEAREIKLKSRMGEKRYQELIEKRKNRFNKVQAKTSLDMLAYSCLKAMKSVHLENSGMLHTYIVFQLDALQKALSKTFPNDHVVLDYSHFEKMLIPSLESVKKLEHLSFPQFKEPVNKDIKSLSNIVSSVPFCPASKMTEMLISADFKNMTTVQTVWGTYMLVSHALTQSDHSEREEALMKDIQQSYGEFLLKAACFFLKAPEKEQPLLLFQIDPQNKFSAREVMKKYQALSLIFHTDKMAVSEERQKEIQDLFTQIVKIKEKLLQQYWQQLPKHLMEELENLLDHISRIQISLEKLIDPPLQAEASLAKNRNRILLSPTQLEKDSLKSSLSLRK